MCVDHFGKIPLTKLYRYTILNHQWTIRFGGGKIPNHQSRPSLRACDMSVTEILGFNNQGGGESASQRQGPKGQWKNAV